MRAGFPRGFFTLAFLALGALFSAFGAESGGTVAVVFNSRSAQSRAVAEHYAALRSVPTNQVIGLAMPLTETVTRTEYRDELEKPLLAAFEQRGLFRFSVKGGENGRKLTESRIRYVVLCYGVPLRISRELGLIEKMMDKIRPEMQRNEAAVDSELALLPVVEAGHNLTGAISNPWFLTTSAAMLHPTNGVLMVARLDGPTPDVARGLVIKAMEAERDGLWGRAYFDLRGLKDGAYKYGDDVMRGAVETLRRMGFETVVDEKPDTFPAAFPMSHIAFYAGWYDVDASGPFVAKRVEFVPGAFAYHLHSYNGTTLRSTNRYWLGPLLSRGVTVTFGSVDEPYLEGTPDVTAFTARFAQMGFTFGEAAYASINSLSWQTTVVGDPLYRPFARSLKEQHDALARSGSRLIEWSHLRVVNLNLALGSKPAEMIGYLLQEPRTDSSAVLLEKLGDLCVTEGRLNSAVDAYSKALQREPSPNQRLRLLLALGEQFEVMARTADQYDLYLRLLDELPEYAGAPAIYEKLKLLAVKLGKSPVKGRPDAARTKRPGDGK